MQQLATRHLPLRRLGVAAAGLLLALLAACGGRDEPTEPAKRPSGLAVVDQAGGTVVGEDNARIVVPPNALDEKTSLSIAQNAGDAPALPTGVAPAGSVFELLPHGARFAEPVQLRLPFDAGAVPAGSRVALAKAELGGNWHLIEDVQVEGGQLVAAVRDFSFVIPVVVPTTRGITGAGGGGVAAPEFRLVSLNPGVGTVALTGEIGLLHRQTSGARLVFRIDATIPADSTFNLVCGTGATLKVYSGPAKRYRLASDPASAERLGGYRAVREPVASLPLVAGTTQSLTFTAGAIDQLFNTDIDRLPPGVIYPPWEEGINPNVVTAFIAEVDCGSLVLPNVVPRFAVAPAFSASSPRALLEGPQDVAAVALQPARYRAVVFRGLSETPVWTRRLSDGRVETVSTPSSPSAQLPDHSLLRYGYGAFVAYFMTSAVTLAEHDQSEVSLRINSDGLNLTTPPARLTIPGGLPAPQFTVEPSDWRQEPGQAASLSAVFTSTPVPSYASWQIRLNPDAPWNTISTRMTVQGWTTRLDERPGFSYYATPNVFRATPTSGRTYLTRSSPLTIEDNGRQFRVCVSNSGGTTCSRIATLTVSTGQVAPRFTVQPADTTVAAGAPVELSYRSAGTEPVSIQWYFNGRAVPGGNYRWLNIAAVNAGNAGDYQVELRNAEGRALSRVARLTVLGAGTPVPPVITTQPASITVPEGAAAGFAVAVSGATTPSYQWQREGVDIPGATAPTLEIPNVRAADAGAYAVLVTAGGVSVRSAVARLNLGAAATAPTISTPPTGLVVNTGQTATLAVAASGSAPLAYQWQRDGSNLPGATSPVLVIDNAQPSDAGRYTVKVSNGRGEVTSAEAVLVVRPAPGAPAISTQPLPQSVLVGDTARFTAAVTGNPAPLCLWTRNGIVIAGATDCTALALPAVTLADDGAVINVFAYSSGGFVAGNGARLTVATAVAPTFTTLPNELVITAGGGGTITAAATGAPTPTIEWFLGSTPLPGSGRYVFFTCSFDYEASVGSVALRNVTADCDRAIVFARASNSAGSVSFGGQLTVKPSVASATLVAGLPGVIGSADGASDVARFNTPNYLTVARDGALAVGDFGNSTIRIAAGGVVKTFAGTAGVFGFADATGTSARFNGNGGLAYDSAGNLFVSDWDNHVVRRITPDGVVTTVAGSPGVPGSTDGTGSAARLRNPNGLAIDKSDNLYVVDWGNHTIRRITPAGVVSTLAGTAGLVGLTDGAGAAARFNTPGAVAIDGDGNLYVSDMVNHTIRKVTPAGVVSTWAGQPGLAGHVDGEAGVARFESPAWLSATADGTLFVVSAAGDTVRRVTPAGVVSTVAGVKGDSGAVVLGTDPRLRNARGVWAVSNREFYLSADQSVLLIVVP